MSAVPNDSPAHNVTPLYRHILVTGPDNVHLHSNTSSLANPVKYNHGINGKLDLLPTPFIQYYTCGYICRLFDVYAGRHQESVQRIGIDHAMKYTCISEWI